LEDKRQRAEISGQRSAVSGQKAEEAGCNEKTRSIVSNSMNAEHDKLNELDKRCKRDNRF
jgi:hypothetical protein